MGCAALGLVLLLIGRPRLEPVPDPLASSSRAPQYLRHPHPTYAEEAGQPRPAIKFPGVEQRLVIASEFERIAGFLGSGLSRRFRWRLLARHC
jgi:hypothetical protein